MDSFVTVIIVIVVGAIITWFKKLGNVEETNDDAPPRRSVNTSTGQARPNTQRPQGGAVGWEEELRRLLEGQTPVAPPPVRRPPPVVISQPPRPTPPAPPPVFRPANLPPPRVLQTVPTPRPSPVNVQPRPLATLKESNQAYTRASNLDVTVAQHIQSVPGQHVQLTKVVRHEASPELVKASALFRNAQSARLAIIGSIVLGPPKALER